LGRSWVCMEEGMFDSSFQVIILLKKGFQVIDMFPKSIIKSMRFKHVWLRVTKSGCMNCFT